MSQSSFPYCVADILRDTKLDGRDQFKNCMVALINEVLETTVATSEDWEAMLTIVKEYDRFEVLLEHLSKTRFTSAELEAVLTVVNGRREGNPFERFLNTLRTLQTIPGAMDAISTHMVGFIENERIGSVNPYGDYPDCLFLCEKDGETPVSGHKLTPELVKTAFDEMSTGTKQTYLYVIVQHGVLHESMRTRARKKKSPELFQVVNSLTEAARHLRKAGEDARAERWYAYANEDKVSHNPNSTVLVHRVESDRAHSIDGDFVSKCTSVPGIDEPERLQMMHPCLAENQDVAAAGEMILEKQTDGQQFMFVDDESGHYMEPRAASGKITVDSGYLHQEFSKAIGGMPVELKVQLVKDRATI